VSKIATKQKRRNWNSKSLQFEDYAFAVSTNRGRWESPSHTWHRRLVLDCLAWEIEREFVRCKKQPFVIARKNWIEEIQQYHKPKPRDWQPLNEVLELEQAIEVIKQQPQFPLSTFHVFEIEHQEGVEITVQRFRNWLVKKSTVRGKQKGRRFICANGAGAFSWQASSGRRDVPRALLRALAVRRLKLAAYTRQNAAEQALQMNDPLLGRDQWKDLPKKADAEIVKYERNRTIEKELLG
jgi:hypothetical protein